MAQPSGDVKSCILKIDGQAKLSSTTGDTPLGTIESLRIDLRLDAPGMFAIELSIRSEATVTALDELSPGQAVEILLGDVGKEESVFKGEVHYLEPHFRFDGVSTVSVGGYDHSHRLTRGTASRTWGDGNQSSEQFPSVVRDVIQKSGDSLSTGTVDSVSTSVTYVPQLNVSDYQMLQWLSRAGGRDLQPDAKNDKKLGFADRDVSGQPLVTLVRESPRGDSEEAGHEARLSMSTVRQVKTVIVRGWDALNKKSIVGKATSAKSSFGGTPGHKVTGKALYGSASSGKEVTIVDHPVESQQEAEAVAQALFDRLSMDFLTGEADFPGRPDVVPGVLVKMRGFGTRFDGKYLVTEASHELIPKGHGYTTRIKIARNDAEGS